MRIPTVAATIMTCLLLSGCGPDSRATAGSVEIGAAMTCESGSHPECIEVMDEHVLLDSVDFQPAGVESAAAVQQDDREVVEVIFDEHGADVLRAVSTTAAEEHEARLVLRAATGELLTAVQVPRPISGHTAQITLSPQADAQEWVELILQGH